MVDSSHDSNAIHDTKAVLARTERAQAEASDPNVSAWVSANAGAGKTHVLKSRVLRILLAGTPPDRILCLTYTKAAAAEMAGRVFKDLSIWATADEAVLETSLTSLLVRKPTAQEAKDARALFARAIETPGGLKVQTIHAFCERLLQRFPLEAGVPPGFAILDDQEGVRLIREAVDGVLSEAVATPDGPLGQALERAVAFAAGDAFDTMLGSALAQREWLDAMTRHIGSEHEGVAAVGRLYRTALGVRTDVSSSDIEKEMAGVVSNTDLARAATALGEGGKNDNKLADALRAAGAAASDTSRAERLRAAFLTAKDEPRADSFVSKAVQAANPDIYDRLRRARDRVADLVTERQGLLVVEASLALMLLAGDVMQRYASAKQLRAALDFQDLIERTARLLSDGEAAAWVLLKLDGGLDHILVDEAQDTSPLQWEVIKALAAEFFPVTGGQSKPRTVFAVGDEKQSIYSFQGAEPRMFAQSGDHFRRSAEAALLALRRVPLTLSFRTVEPLLRAVDRVLSDAGRTPGLTAGNEPINHVALRLGHAGCFEIWETEKPVEVDEEPDAWLPLSEKPQALPATRLAERIADTIARWLRDGEMLASEGRPVRAGDVLVLLRKRHPFAAPMVAALKTRGIPVAGADRLKTTEQLAVQDLMVLGDFLTLPEDDLALATVLKSPLFGLDDDDLMRLAVDRKGAMLWSRLLAAAKTEARFGPAAETLLKWRGIADQSPPFEFYAHVLDRDGGRKRLIGRLGPEAVETLTEFLNLAIEFDEAETPSLSGFLQWLRAGSREVKRDMEHGRDEVRVLTVHGAKGLEAPIVFLPDTCSAPGGAQQGKLVALEGSGLALGSGKPVAWPVKGTSGVVAVKAAKDAQKVAEREEANRLLYVALTRARDRIYVAGFEGKKGRPKDCWYDIIETGLAGNLEETGEDGQRLLRISTPQTAETVKPKDLTAALVFAEEPPAWSRTPAPREPQLALPLAPSRIAPYDVDEAGDPITPQLAPGATPEEPAAPSPLEVAGSNRFQRGLLTHALLEHLPTIAPERWQVAAEAFVASRGHMLPQRVRGSIVAEVLALIGAPSFAAAFGPGSRAEVPIVAEIPEPGGRGRPLRLNAVIDRLVVRDHDVLIIDYKTNRPPPSEPAKVASAYLVQLAAYRLALGRIHPDRQIRAAILWTDGARLMEIPADLLDAAERDLWLLARARLDA